MDKNKPPYCICTRFFIDCGEAARLWSEALTCHINNSPNAATKWNLYRAHKGAAELDSEISGANEQGAK